MLGKYFGLIRDAAPFTHHPIKFLFANLVLGALFNVPLLLLVSPALIAFALANKHPGSRVALENFAEVWLLSLLAGATILLFVLPVIAIRNARHKKQLIRNYENKIRVRGRR